MVIKMKKIVYVKGLKTEEDVKKLQEELDQTRLVYEIHLKEGFITFQGSGDEVYIAKTAIQRAGYKVL